MIDPESNVVECSVHEARDVSRPGPDKVVVDARCPRSTYKASSHCDMIICVTRPAGRVDETSSREIVAMHLSLGPDVALLFQK